MTTPFFPLIQQILAGIVSGETASLPASIPPADTSNPANPAPATNPQPLHPKPETLRFDPIGGGSINDTYRISTPSGSEWFAKINTATALPGLFEKERQGLSLLATAGVIRIPEVIGSATDGQYQVLVLEWIEQGTRTREFWRLLGEQLAALHHVSRDTYGLETDNFMGSLPQSNDPASSWTGFFIKQRLKPQVRMASDKGLLPATALRQFENLYKALPGIFPEEAPCLLHGDLWSGNFLCDEAGRPVLIDPAVYFGHRGMDLAMTTLFGGFDPAFYESYNHHFPLPGNYREQWEICNLYPLLIHLNLFGIRPSSEPRRASSPVVLHAALGYLKNILDTIQRF